MSKYNISILNETEGQDKILNGKNDLTDYFNEIGAKFELGYDPVSGTSLVTITNGVDPTSHIGHITLRNGKKLFVTASNHLVLGHLIK